MWSHRPDPKTPSATSWEKTTVDSATVVRPTRKLGPIPGNNRLRRDPDRGVEPGLPGGLVQLRHLHHRDRRTSEAGWGDTPGRVKAISFTAWNPTKHGDGHRRGRALPV